MRVTTYVCGLLSCLTISSAFAEKMILPERTTTVTVSNRDINRVNCPGPVQDVFFSKEKPVAISTDSDNVFVKFLVRREGSRETLVKTPLDLHVVCDGQVYTLILEPADQQATTVRLGDNRMKTAKANAKQWGSIAMEEQVKKFTLAVYRDDLPQGFKKRHLPEADPRQQVRAYSDLKIEGLYEVIAPGVGLRATEYRIVATAPMELKEKDFLLRQLGQIVGVTVEPLRIEAGQSARLIIIDRSMNHDGS